MVKFRRRYLLIPACFLVLLVAVLAIIAGIEKQVVDDNHGFHLTVTYTGFGFPQSDHPIWGRR